MRQSLEYIHLSNRPQHYRRALAIGNFDGVHLGHQELIRRVCREANRRGVESSVLTFNPHPQDFLNPGSGPRPLMTLEEKVACMAELGIDSVFIQPFTREFASMVKEDFARYLVDRLDAMHVVVGFNYTFGQYGSGKAVDLRALGKSNGFSVDIVPAQMMDGESISSTRIRNALARGDEELASRLLGHPLPLDGFLPEQFSCLKRA